MRPSVVFTISQIALYTVTLVQYVQLLRVTSLINSLMCLVSNTFNGCFYLLTNYHELCEAANHSISNT